MFDAVLVGELGEVGAAGFGQGDRVASELLDGIGDGGGLVVVA